MAVGSGGGLKVSPPHFRQSAGDSSTMSLSQKPRLCSHFVSSKGYNHQTGQMYPISLPACSLTEQAAAINRYYCKPHPLFCALGSGTDPQEKPHKKEFYGLSAAPVPGAAVLQLTSWTMGLN